jgi:dihydrofolate reductase
MSITLILAVSQNGIIGKDGLLPWKLPNDMKHFQALTMGKVVVMGRKTYESIPAPYRPLKGRENWILTTNPDYQAPDDVTVFTDPEPILAASMLQGRDLMVIGGAEIYELFLTFADRIEMTLVKADFEGDASFDAWQRPNWDIGWELKNRREFVPDDKHPVPYSFITYVRKR